MLHKIVILCVAVAVANAHVASIVETAPTFRIASIPSFAKVQELSPSVSSHFRTEVINPGSVNIGHVAAPLISAGYKTEFVAAPSVARVEHLAPAHSLYKAEVLAPTISRLEHLVPSIATHKTEVISSPILRYETAVPALKYETAIPTVARVEHLSPVVGAHKAFLSSPSLRYEIGSPSVAHVTHSGFANVEGVAHATSDIVSPRRLVELF